MKNILNECNFFFVQTLCYDELVGKCSCQFELWKDQKLLYKCFSSLIPLFYPFGKSGCEYKKNAGNFESDETSF